MRKFLVPVINLVNIILVSIVFGLGSNTAVYETIRGVDSLRGNYYQLVWGAADKANALGIVGFFLFVVAVAATVATFIPFKCRKYTLVLVGAMYIAAGVLFLNTPNGCDQLVFAQKLSDSLIAMAVLVFIAGAFTLGAAALELTAKKEAK